MTGFGQFGQLLLVGRTVVLGKFGHFGQRIAGNWRRVGYCQQRQFFRYGVDTQQRRQFRPGLQLVTLRHSQHVGSILLLYFDRVQLSQCDNGDAGFLAGDGEKGVV